MQANSSNDHEIQLQEINDDIQPQKKLDIIDINYVYPKKDITNREIILCMCDLGMNSEFYGYDCSNKTKSFLSRILTYEYTKPIFEGFSAETLKKYWLMICKTDIESFSNIIINNEKAINEANLKLRAIIYEVAKKITIPFDIQKRSEKQRSNRIKNHSKI